jgi:hypothetical protein
MLYFLKILEEIEEEKNMQQGVPPPAPVAYPQKSGLGTAGLILSIIGICTFWLLSWISMILGIIGLIFGAVAYWGKWKDAKAGLAAFIIGLITVILVIVWIVVLIAWVASYNPYF